MKNIKIPFRQDALFLSKLTTNKTLEHFYFSTLYLFPSQILNLMTFTTIILNSKILTTLKRIS